MAGDEGKSYISYRDVADWVEDFERVHDAVLSWVLTVVRKRGSGEVVQYVTGVVRRPGQNHRLEPVMQSVKSFGRGTDHATLPGAMLACMQELDFRLYEKEGRRLEDDPLAGRNPFT